MTGKELINWIIEHDAQELDVMVKYRNGKTYYNGVGSVEPEIEDAYNEDETMFIFMSV